MYCTSNRLRIDMPFTSCMACLVLGADSTLAVDFSLLPASFLYRLPDLCEEASY